MEVILRLMMEMGEGSEVFFLLTRVLWGEVGEVGLEE